MLLAQIINILAQFYVLLIIVSIVLSYFMSPYHPLRQGIDGLVQPLLEPIRRIIPPVGMLDFSPLVLIIVIQVVSNLIVRFLIAIS